MPNNTHKLLKNEVNQNDGFKKTRGFKKQDNTEPEEVSPRIIQAVQKSKLRRSTNLLLQNRQARLTEKTLDIPISIELIRIYFFVTFNSDLQGKFFDRYGLNIVEYTDFNRTVLFEISNDRGFNVFINHIRQAAASTNEESYEGKPYNLIALINDLTFFTSQDRINGLSESGFLISLISSSNRASVSQKQRLLQFLNQASREISYNENFPELIEVQVLNQAQVSALVRNFDIIKEISSTRPRPIKIRPGSLGNERRDYGFDVNTPEDLPLVGVIDTGVSKIRPLRNIITDISYDHTGQGAFNDASGHGTMVAALVILGDEFQNQVLFEYEAKARIVVIKPIHNDNDSIDVPRLLFNIKDAKRRHGVRLFNMSLSLAIVKPYNSSFSAFAYELDKLAFEEDIIVFMSVGNYPVDDLEELLVNNPHPSYNYPNFFYDLSNPSTDHECWFTNIQEPSESLNNISVSALAGNIEGNDNQDITPASEYPAYYSRKFHIDYSQKVNGNALQKNQKNKFLAKPDLVYEGGDLFTDSAGIEVICPPVANIGHFYTKSCGTSIATPFVTSLAAQISYLYPTLSTQSIKALLINNASSEAGKLPPAFLGNATLYKSLIGFGKPQKNNLLLTDDDTATWIIEDSIQNDDLKTIPIQIPEIVGSLGNKLHIEATLCYSFLPVKDNHLSYIPLHISFGVFKNVNSNTIATSIKAELYQIKAGISWSEDFHGIENRQFSNTQKISFNIQPYDLIDLGNEFAIAVRCIGKTNIPEAIRQYIENTEHKYSIAFTISEISKETTSGRLYNELSEINTVENISILDSEGDIEL